MWYFICFMFTLVFIFWRSEFPSHFISCIQKQSPSYTWYYCSGTSILESIYQGYVHKGHWGNIYVLQIYFVYLSLIRHGYWSQVYSRAGTRCRSWRCDWNIGSKECWWRVQGDVLKLIWETWRSVLQNDQYFFFPNIDLVGLFEILIIC